MSRIAYTAPIQPQKTRKINSFILSRIGKFLIIVESERENLEF